MLKFNTFRSDRYLRSKFVEGRYFLASEATDLELEIIDLLRRTLQKTIGDVAIDNAWKVSRINTTQLLIEPGDAWFHGLPFSMRSGSDQLVSGASLSLGTVPAGVSITDSATGAGKILTFTNTTTPTDLYRIVISAEEQIVTDIDDPFLKNANLPESTGQKIRLLLKLHIVSESAQTETPVPYTPNTGAYNVANMVNQIIINPSSGQNGELLVTNPISGSASIDGRDLELTIRNDPGVGSGVKIPNGASDQQAFYNGKLIDSLGNEYHINAIFNDTVSTQVIIRLDKEVGQPNPTLTNGTTYTLHKRDVYVTDDTSGNPLGRLFWSIATADWNTTSGFVHNGVITDLRHKSISDEDFQDTLNQKVNLVLVGGGIIGVDIDGYTLHWSSNFTIINPTGPEQQIDANEVVLLDGGSAVYVMDLDSGGTISVGNLAVTADTFGSTVHFTGSPSLASVKIGNVLQIGSEVAQITAVNDVAKTVDITPATTGTGSGTIYRDSFASGTVILDDDLFVLASRKGSEIIIGNTLHLSAGKSNAIYDEKILYPSGYTAGTDIDLPSNTRNSNKPQYASSSNGELKVFVNQLLKDQGVDWDFVDSDTIAYNFDLPNNSEVRFRIDSLPAGSLGGGSGASGSLQAAYNIGNVVNVITGVPVTINGSSGKLLVVNGDVEITGVIDPSGIELTSQSSNPLSALSKGLWVDTSGNLMYEKGGSTLSLSEAVEDLVDGVGSISISREYLNTSGFTILVNKPVYCPGAGSIALANNSTLPNAKVIGITTETILDGETGKVALVGVVEGFTGFSHNALVYLDDSDGDMTSTAPVPGSGNYQVLIGQIEGTNLILKPTVVGKA